MGKAIPKLRFNEFREVWRLSVMESLLVSYRLGGNYDNNESGNGVPLIKMGNLSRGNIVLDKIQYISSPEVLDEKDKIKYGDLFFNTRNTLDLVGKVAIWRDELQLAYYNSNLMYLKFEDNFFMNYRLNSYQGIKSLRRLATGTTSVAAIYTKDLLKVKLLIPSLPEQQKIASFLSAVDEKMQRLTRQKELLEQYIKGAMQQLFSGKLRFKDENGKTYAKWEKKKLGDVADVKRGAASQHLNYVSDETKGVRLLRINDFLSDGAVYVENTDEMKRYTVRTNDLLIAGTGATAGIIFIVPKKFNNLSFSYNAPRIRVTNAHHTFIYYYLKSDIILKQQKKLFVGNAQPFLDTDAMRGFKIDLPSREEQQKIANFLSAINTKIESVGAQIEKTQTFKKGLLQQMFV